MPKPLCVSDNLSIENLISPDPIVKGGLREVMDNPGLGVEFTVKEAKKYLAEEDKNFFD